MGAHCTRKQIRMLIVAKRNNTRREWSLSVQPPSTYWARHSQSLTPSPSLNVVFAYVHKRFVAQIFYKVIYVWNTHSQSSEKQSSEKGVQFLFLQFRLPGSRCCWCCLWYGCCRLRYVGPWSTFDRTATLAIIIKMYNQTEPPQALELGLN